MAFVMKYPCPKISRRSIRWESFSIDIEAAVTLVFAGGKLRIEEGIAGSPEIVIRTTSDCVMDLNALKIVVGLPWYLDEAGRRVLGHLFAGRLKISGMFVHLALLTRLTKIMSVM